MALKGKADRNRLIAGEACALDSVGYRDKGTQLSKNQP